MSHAAFAEQTLPQWKRAVLKVGSSLLAEADGLSPKHALGLAQFVAASLGAGREVVIVSSGAVAAGRGVLHRSSSGHNLAEKQALAALGQAQLIALWQRFFERPVAQVLLTHDDLRNRRRYLNARATLGELLQLGAIPVVNENDTVSVDELKLGDNDNLAAIVAALVDADALFIASDIDGFYTANPRTSAENAHPIDEVEALTPEFFAMAGGSGSSIGTGGMRTKLEAAAKAGAAGIETYLFNGTHAATVQQLARGKLHGTRFRAAQNRMAARKYWLRNAPVEAGLILVDAGAAQAMRDKGASLLPGGVSGAEGDFRRGDMIEVALRGDAGTQLVARGICQYSAADVRRIAKKHSRDIDAILGYNYGENVIHRDDLVIL